MRAASKRTGVLRHRKGSPPLGDSPVDVCQVHHCLTKGTDTPMSTEVTEYNARVALYNGFVAETEKWSTLPVKPVKQAPPVPMFEGVQGKQRKAKGARKAAARSASAKPSDDLHADGADEAMLDTEL